MGAAAWHVHRGGSGQAAAGATGWNQAQLSINAQLGRERVMALHALLDDRAALLKAAQADPPAMG
jgi:hypothetical protein